MGFGVLLLVGLDGEVFERQGCLQLRRLGLEVSCMTAAVARERRLSGRLAKGPESVSEALRPPRTAWQSRTYQQPVVNSSRPSRSASPMPRRTALRWLSSRSAGVTRWPGPRLRSPHVPPAGRSLRAAATHDAVAAGCAPGATVIYLTIRHTTASSKPLATVLMTRGHRLGP